MNYNTTKSCDCEAREYINGVLNVLKDRLLNSEYSTEKTKFTGKHISPLICPVCGKAEAWAYAEKPLSIVCNRKNQCGARTKTTSLFNVFENIAEQYPPTDDDPYRPAKQFLRARGISESIIEKSGVLYFSDIKRDNESCGPAAMFKLSEKVLNGRLFRPPARQGKTHNVGPVSGHFWRMPGMEYDPNKETFVLEGILDALSLLSMGKQAIAVLGAGYKPGRFDLSEFKNLIFAFDNDMAGRAATRAWMQHFKDSDIKVSAILPGKNTGDWNDFLISALTPQAAAERFKKDLPEFEFQGKLALAASALKYAETYVDRTGYAPGLFAFRKCYYWSWVRPAKENQDETVHCQQVGDFNIEVLHALRDDTDQDLPVFSHRLKIKPAKRQAVTATARAEDLKGPDPMKTFFLKHGRCLWTGQAEACNGLLKLILGTKCPVVRQLDKIGYDHETGFHVLQDITFDQTGKAIYPEDGLFNVGSGNFIRPPRIETLKPGNCDFQKFYELINDAWGVNSAVALSFMFASLFVNQVKSKLRFFPFLSLSGDPQTGKSRLLTILNNMQGLDQEGLSMTTANTKKGELRELSKVSGMFKGLIEGNDTRKARFDFESILPLYNFGNPLQTRALKSNDSRTHELPFHGSLIFAQNMEPFKSRAAKERVISLKFSTDDLGNGTKAAFDELVTKRPCEFAGVLPAIFKNRQIIESSWYTEHEKARADLFGSVPDNRICENHAVILAFHRILCRLFNIDHDLQPAIETLGKEKIISCQVRELTPADHFFDALDGLPDHVTGLNGVAFSEPKNKFCLIKDGAFIFNRPMAEEAIRAAGLTLDFPERLGAALQDHPAFIRANKSVRFGDGKNRKAFVFDIKKLSEG